MALAQAGVVPQDLRLDQASLDDAFVALTGRRLAEDPDAHSPVHAASPAEESR